MANEQPLSRDGVEAVRAATDIVEIIGQTVTLKGAGGARMKGLCPFHREKTPSFTVDRDRQRYHCYGCGRSGDVFSFLRELEGLTFGEALRKLADRAGVRLPDRRSSGSKPGLDRGRLHELLAFAATFYAERYTDANEGAMARGYTDTRGFSLEMAERFQFGYAPAGWDNLLRAARSAGFAPALLENSGLFQKGTRGPYDFFRNRLMFPIRDVSDRVVAFGGRALDDSPAKYINSAESPIFKKSRTLYGLPHARESLRERGVAVVVEGYFDWLRCFEAGITNAVATCGTALTSEHARLLRRYVPETVLVYDGDTAGLKAALKATRVLMGEGLGVRALALPAGQDPDDYIRAHGAAPFAEGIESAQDFVTFYVEQNRERVTSIEGRTAVTHEIFELVNELEDVVRRDEYVRLTARAMGLDEWACRREFERFLRAPQPAAAGSRAEAAEPVVRANREDAVFVASVLADREQLERAARIVQSLPGTAGPVGEVVAALKAAAPGQEPELHSEAAEVLYATGAVLDAPEPDMARSNVERRLRRLTQDALRTRWEALQAALRTAEGPAAAELLKEQIDVRRKLEQVGAP